MQSFPDYQVDDGPAQEQGTGQLPLEAPEVLDGAGDVQNAGAGMNKSCIWLEELAKSQDLLFLFFLLVKN